MAAIPLKIRASRAEWSCAAVILGGPLQTWREVLKTFQCGFESHRGYSLIHR
jgi:hypothetical protein